MDKIILTDADGCLLNWNKGFAEYMTKKGLPQLPGKDTDYSISVRHGISGSDSLKYITEFNEGPEVGKLEAFADSVEYVSKFANDGFRFIVVTSISDSPQAAFYRKRNLKRVFGDVFKDVHCIALGASKNNILKNWENTGYYWIEDHRRQAEAGHEAGLKTILINHPYNHDYETVLFPRVSLETPWQEIYKIVTEDYTMPVT